jgi:hypothetical protein
MPVPVRVPAGLGPGARHVGVPDERWGERPLATVVLSEGRTVTAEELREFLRATVACWQLPERWAFIEAVPKTSVGKFDKKRLRASYAEGTLPVGTIARHSPYGPSWPVPRREGPCRGLLRGADCRRERLPVDGGAVDHLPRQNSRTRG